MAGPGTKLSRHGAHLASCATKFAQRGASTVVSAKKFARRGAFTGSPATKFAQHATNRRFWGIFRALGELFRAHTHHQTELGELCTARGAGVGTKLSQHAASASPTGTKLSQHAPPAGPTGTKLSRLAIKRLFWTVFRMRGEFCHARATNRPRREKKVTHQHAPRPTNVPLPQFCMQFDCMKFQQHSETLQFQRSQFKS